jgi:vacuolar-type H+-ATPase subunit H
MTGSAAFAQFGAVKDGAEKVGSATKEAGKATAEATKDAAKATEKGTKKVAGETKKAVQTTYRCADGSTDQATVKSNACRDHGGVKRGAKH